MSKAYEAMYRPANKEAFYKQLYQAAMYERELFKQETTTYSEWLLYVGLERLDMRYYSLLAVDSRFFESLGGH